MQYYVRFTLCTHVSIALGNENNLVTSLGGVIESATPAAHKKQIKETTKVVLKLRYGELIFLYSIVDVLPVTDFGGLLKE